MNSNLIVYFYCFHEIDVSIYSDSDISGMDGSIVWTYLTARYLNRKGFHVDCGNQPPNKGVIIFHGKDRKKLLEILPSFRNLILVCIQADCNFKLNFSDYRIYQNKEQLLEIGSSYEKFCHFWPQPGLIKRDPSRGVKIENIHYKGLKKHLCFNFNELDFLRDTECRFFCGENYTAPELFWRDYSEADLLLAVRSFDNNTWDNKPASKLLNSWAAGVPALLGRESAFRSLKRSKLDYIEISSVSDIVDSIKYLKSNPDFYRDMISNGLERSAFYDSDAIVNDWINILNEIIIDGKSRFGYINLLPKLLAYFIRKKVSIYN